MPGEYGLVHAYGADADLAPPIQGYQEGEILRFNMNGMPASASADVLWQNDHSPHRVDLTLSTDDVETLFLPLISK